MSKKFDIVHARVFSKAVSVLLVFFMIASLSPVLADQPETAEIIEINENVVYAEPAIKENTEGYIDIYMNGATETTLTQGKPMLPKTTVVKKIPLNAKDISVSFSHSPFQEITFEGTIAPGPIPQLLSEEQNPILNDILGKLSALFSRSNYQVIEKPTSQVAALDDEIYESDKPYGQPFTYEIYAGIDTDNVRKLFIVCTIQPFTITSMSEQQARYFLQADITITYTEETTTSLADETYDLLILAPSSYISDLQPLVTHKEEMGLDTKLVVLDDIYNEVYFEKSEEFSRDIQEEIKYFLYQAVPEWDVQYVMAVGGWRSFFGLNRPTVQFPVRYSHNVDGEPGYIAEQYYSCFERLDKDSGELVFDSWDSNGNGVFAEWHFGGWDWYDPLPDVYFGRLACRNRLEVRTMVDKIITYETEAYDAEWFNKMISVTGDGFQDMGYLTDVTVNWDVTSVPNGDYTIYAQSRTTETPYVYGEIDEVRVTVDHNAPSRVTFVEDDHLKIYPLEEDQETLYPAKPVAEISVPSDGNILGNTNVGPYVPGEAYLGEFWAGVEYNATNEVMKIRSKSYNPVPHDFEGQYYPHAGPMLATIVEGHGSHTILEIWVNNTDGETIYGPVSKSSDMYYEGEIEATQSLFYAGDEFEKNRIWCSNGKFYTMNDVLDAFSEGYGLAYVNGHSSCLVYGDHLPGIPGGRRNGQVNGWATINLQAGLQRYQADEGDPLFPLDQLTNGDKLPVLLYSGCHSGQFDTSFASMFMDPYNVLFGDRYGTWAPEGAAWWITRLPQGGSIATIGNTGLGSGYIGKNILTGLTGWLFPTFFYNYQHDGIDILGACHTQTLIEYANRDDPVNDQTVRKHFEQWNLLGDPSLKIGGYPPETSAMESETDDVTGITQLEPSSLEFILSTSDGIASLDTEEYLVTENPALDSKPQDIISDGEDTFLVSYFKEIPLSGELHPGFAYSVGGIEWSEIVVPNPLDSGFSTLDSWEDEEGTHYLGSICFGARSFGAMIMPDITNPYTWSTPRWGWSSTDFFSGKHGLTVTGYTDDDGTHRFAGLWTQESGIPGYEGVWYMAETSSSVVTEILIEDEPSDFNRFASDGDDTTGRHYWACSNENSYQLYVAHADPKTSDIELEQRPGLNPDVAADDGWAYVVYETSAEQIKCMRTSDEGAHWTTFTISDDGIKPRIVIKEDGSLECFFIKNMLYMYKSVSTDHGDTWSEPELISEEQVDFWSYSPFVVCTEALVYDNKNDDDLYAQIFVPTTAATVENLALAANGKMIQATLVNTGTEYIMNGTWHLMVEGDSPLGQYFGGSPLLMSLFRGRVFSGANAADTLFLTSGQTLDISSGPLFGIGHILVTISVLDSDGEMLAEETEDGFLLGGRILLSHGEE